MDGYIRVSDVAGRSGDSYRSPTDQRDAIETWADRHGVTLGEIVTEENVSGAVKPEDRALGRLLERVERGESAGIIVWRSSRFCRDAAETLTAAKRMMAAGGRLVGVEDGVDTDEPSGKLVLALMAALAESELDKIRAGWKRARKGAVERGIAPSRVPRGYLRGNDGRLVIDPDVAPKVREVFRRRARGASLTSLCEYLEAEGVKPWRANSWARSSVQKMIRSRTYLGEIRSGEHVLEGAHEPLVSQAEWQAAQAARVVREKTGELSSQSSLAGLARCAGCGHVLQVGRQWSNGKGSKRANYYCRKRSGKGECPAPAYVSVAKLDEYVESRVFEAFDGDGPIAEAVRATSNIENAVRDLEDAQTALTYFLTNTRLVATLGEAQFEEAVENARRDVELARAALAEIQGKAELVGEIVGGGSPIAAWPLLAPVERRQLLRALLDRVVVRRAMNKGEVVRDRVQVVWKGNVTYDEERD